MFAQFSPSRFCGAMFVMMLMLVLPLQSQEAGPLTFSGTWFLAYDMSNDQTPDNEFLLKRGYFTSQKKINDNFLFRITQDVTVDREGDGLGDIEIRLKYGYLRYQQPKFGPLTDAFVEFGVVHRPWVDFEQTINHYRVQGSMYLERNRLLRSADYGMMVGGQFGGKVDTSYQKRVNKKNPGKYGSLAVGIYNGGGYEAVENNNNKLVEGRLSLRPFPEAATGFQVSLFGAYGKGNTAEAPDFSLGGAYLSYESPAAVLAATVFQGVGDLLGTAVDSLGNSLDKTGYSLFADVRLIHKRWRAFGRLDNLTTDRPEGEISQDRYIAGLAFAFLKSSKFVLDFEYTPDNVSNTNDMSVVELALEVNF